MLGVRVPVWIKGHAAAGTARRRGKRKQVTWELHALPDHVRSGYVLGERGAARVMAYQERNMQKHFKAKIRAFERKAAKKLNK